MTSEIVNVEIQALATPLNPDLGLSMVAVLLRRVDGLRCYAALHCMPYRDDHEWGVRKQVAVEWTCEHGNKVDPRFVGQYFLVPNSETWAE